MDINLIKMRKYSKNFLFLGILLLVMFKKR
jgi:hypothetical protein